MNLKLPAIQLDTQRLILRMYDLDDFPAYAEMTADPESFRYSERGAMSSDEAWTRMLRHSGHWALLSYGIFAIEEKESGRFVGEAGFGDFRRGLGPAFDGPPEGAWAISGWAQGRGYATEAAEAALGWVERELGARRTVCLIHAENAPSLSVARKLGYVPFQQCTYRGYAALLHERVGPRSD